MKTPILLFLSLVVTAFFSQPVNASQNLDVDGDGNADILWRNQVTGQNWLWTMNGVAVKESKSLNTIGLHWDIVGRGDFDGDGKSDIFWRNNESGRNYIYLMDGFTIRGSTELNYLPYFDWKVRGITDVNGDGKDDVIWRHQTTGRTWLYTIDGTSIIDSKGLNTVADLNWKIVGTGDVDGDGKGDVIWRHSTSGKNFIWLMNGTTIKDSYILNTVTPSWHIVGVADLDGDNTDDIIWRSESGTNWAYLMDSGQIGTSKQINKITNTDWHIRTVGDLNGDGKADIFWRNQSTGKTYAYLMDGTNIIGDGYSNVISLNWKIITESIFPTSGAVVTPEEPEVDEAQVYYEENISAQIIQSKCVLCHTSTGAAGNTRLILENSSTANYQAINQKRIADFLGLDDVDSTYLLTKAQGGLTHGGGGQIIFGSEEYEALSTYLGLVSGGGNSGSTSDFWEGVGLLNNKQTLRKAALIFGGRLPTDEEYASVADNKDASLKAAIRNVMAGDGFHSFLTDGANDRLHTYKFFQTGGQFLDLNAHFLPEAATQAFEARKAGGEALEEHWQKHRIATLAFAKAAPKLIAHVVENEKSYSEILTADYTMVNPILSGYYRSDASFDDPTDLYEIVPAQLKGFMLADESFTSNYTEMFGLEILTEGPIITWPHAGILNDPAFLERYPSTATNRNRARSRWAQYFFLDFDIEKSAARTNDPVALADTNNPTMNNTNCTVCHIPMDPIAGAFQNYGDIGYYRDQWGGKDSLADTYKWPEDGNSPYQEGDTWYRDMREPGFYGETVPDADHSLQWLAEKIINDDRFAVAAVKFWWPAVFGSKPVYAPEISSDYDYQSKTAVYNAQSSFIADVSDSLRSHMNLKDTLVDLALSEWFRSNTMTEEAFNLHASNRSGKGRLLSPELLDKKTKAVFGLSWGEHYPEWNGFQRRSEFQDSYKLTYGGIDSDGVINRAEEMTSIMSQVALTQSAEMACEIVVNDFIKEESEKVLFEGLDKFTVPTMVSSQTFEISGYQPGNDNSSSQKLTTNNRLLRTGEYLVSVSFLNDFWDNDTHLNRDLIIDKVILKTANGSTVSHFEGDVFETIGIIGCGGQHNDDDFNIWSNCSVELPIEIDTEGEYFVEVFAYEAYWNDDGWAPAGDYGTSKIAVGLSVTDAFSPNSIGGELIKQTIVNLLQRAWGDELSVDDYEVDLIYELFVTSWKSKRNLDGWNDHIGEDNVNCNFPFGAYNRPENDYYGWELGNDPQSVMSAWRTVILYIMSDYRYLHE